MSSSAIHDAANSSGDVVTTNSVSGWSGCCDPFSNVRLWNRTGASSKIMLRKRTIASLNSAARADS
jgi:hypothetical protein